MANLHSFTNRHIPQETTKLNSVYNACSVTSIDDLINQTIPTNIQKSTPLSIPSFKSEASFFKHAQQLANQNTQFNSHIGLGYYNTLTPAPILRNVFENPGWYTQYTPYQAEISQGRLEALLNFQTIITELTNLPIANASLLDEATAAAEAMSMLLRTKPRQSSATTLAVMNDIFPQTLQVLKTRAKHLDITIQQIASYKELNASMFGVLFQTPNRYGSHLDFTKCIQHAQQLNIPTICCSDLLYLTYYDPPQNIDICVGSSQRFGVPLGYGGPHAAFFACKDSYSRKIPGRIIGVSTDKFNNTAYRMALQTREQHIRKEKATSNICTAQALLAIIASMYALYHGPQGLQHIATHVHHLAHEFQAHLSSLKLPPLDQPFFDTISFHCANKQTRESIKAQCLNQNRLLNLTDPTVISVAFDETHTIADVNQLIKCLAQATNQPIPQPLKTTAPTAKRPCNFMQQPIFNNYHSETELMRYIKKLENKDLSLTTSMIPLGSCTMKLNAAIEMMPLSLPGFSSIHPYAPIHSQQGYQHVIKQLGDWLCEITDFSAVTFQPNSGAQGEYAGILVIKDYQKSINQSQRNIALIPTSAHGTNPASAALAGLDIVGVKCNEQGNIDMDDLKDKCIKHSNELSLLMITYPSTHGVFEENIKDICQLVHNHGAQVYMDGANLNAQVGLTSPGIIGADVCHINLHKTFAIPHGGGGPGMGPICVKKHLAPFLPNFNLDTSVTANSVAAAPYSSASILLISYAYIGLMGAQGLTEASKQAILKANYIKAKLEPYYPILFTGKSNTVAHELIIDCRPFKKQANIDVEDIAKRLIDYSFHAPTLSWPVAGTLMIEPTESESFVECDRFCTAMISIYHEIQAIAKGTADKVDNVLKNAPHIQQEVCADTWEHSYSRTQAAFPVKSLYNQKFWPTIARVNQAKGDRNLICTCDTQLLLQETTT